MYVDAPRHRLTRRERQAETREALLAAAAVVFAERGFTAASLDEIAERAGYTRGAVYANFADKDELFLALVERHKGAFVDAFDRAAALATAQERLAAVQSLLTGGPRGVTADWTVLWAEFWLHATRHPQLAERLAEQERRYRAAVARLLAVVAADLGVELSGQVEELAAQVIALDVGLALQRRLTPDLSPDALGRAIAGLLGIRPPPAAGGPDPEGADP